MSDKKHTSPPENKSISISGDVRDSNVFIGDNNTFIQKFFNIFKSDAETLEQRNRRILLGHVENAWIKGVLDASLHGAALLDLGIKQDPRSGDQISVGDSKRIYKRNPPRWDLHAGDL